MVLIKVVVNSVVLILLFSYVFYLLRKIIKKTNSKNLKLYFVVVTIMHFMISLAFAFFIDNFNIPDAIKFYSDAQEESSWLALFNIGSSFISFLIYPFVKLGVSREVLFLVFSTISFKGFLVYFELIGLKRLEKINKFLLLAFLFPSLHLWTGFLGKEPLLFLLMALLIKNISLKKYNLSLVLMFVLIFLIRPHVFFVLVFSLVIVFLFEKNISQKLKRNVILTAVFSVLIFIPVFLFFFLRIETLNFTSLQSYYTSFMEITANLGRSSVSIESTTIFSRIFYLIFMPLPIVYNIKNELQFVAALENIGYLLFFITIIIFYAKKHLRYRYFGTNQKFALLSSILLILLFSSYLYNLGLGNRMRIMFFPYIFYLLMTIVNFPPTIKIKIN